MHIEKRKSSKGFSYRARISVQGYPLQTKTFKTKKEALEWGREIEADLSRGRLGSPKSFGVTLERAINRFRNEKPDGYGKWLHDKRNQNVLRWWEEHYGDFTLSELRPTDIVRARDLIRNGHGLISKNTSLKKGRAPSTANTYVAGISTVIQASLELWGWVEENPCRKIKRLSLNNSRVRFLSKEEKDKLFEECSKDKDLMDVVLIALLTGARQGEIIGLRWEDIDFDDGLLYFRRTKNKEIRVLPISEALESILKERKLLNIFKKTSLLFPSKDLDQPIDVKHRFRRRCKNAGIENFRFHDLRHCAGSALARAGIPERMMQAILGHKTAQMTKLYSHLRPSDLGSGITVLSEAIE